MSLEKDSSPMAPRWELSLADSLISTFETLNREPCHTLPELLAYWSARYGYCTKKQKLGMASGVPTNHPTPPSLPSTGNMKYCTHHRYIPTLWAPVHLCLQLRNWKIKGGEKTEADSLWCWPQEKWQESSWPGSQPSNFFFFITVYSYYLIWDQSKSCLFLNRTTG